MKEELIIGLLPNKLRPSVRLSYHKFRDFLEQEFYLLPELVGDRKRAIDIGAHNGLYTYELSKLCDSVESFEPQPWLYNKLCDYAIPKASIHNVGLSNKQDYLEINVPTLDGKKLDGMASFRASAATSEKYQVETVRIEVKRLDDYQFKDVSFMKIDVEGYESEVLEGAIETIKTNYPNILIEIEQRHLPDIDMLSVFNLIKDLDYSGCFILDGRRLPIEEFSFEIHQKPYIQELEILNFKNIKKYVNNFIFFPKCKGSK
jgi:FkbM family methyltransferase